jgi:RNA polymerase sigma-70 factor (ECF subfamily)
MDVAIAGRIPKVMPMDPLVERVRAGDSKAMEELLASVAPAVERFGRRMCKNPTDAEDVLQDTLLSIATHLGEYEGRSSLTSWVFALTRSACARRRRGLKNKPHLNEDDVAEPTSPEASPEDRASEHELARALSRALDALSEEHREVILLRDVEGLTAPDAAEALGISVDALKSRLHRARQALRTELTPLLEPNAPKPSPNCPDAVALWSKKLEGDLSTQDCAAMEKHILGCPACAGTCDALRAALSACRNEATSAVRPEVQRLVKAAVRQWSAALAK